MSAALKEFAASFLGMALSQVGVLSLVFFWQGQLGEMELLLLSGGLSLMAAPSRPRKAASPSVSSRGGQGSDVSSF